MSVAATKFQKGEERYILRSQIKEAPYNPRIIGEGAEKRLRAFIKKHGLFGTIIWNERTGNIVSGHQRLKALDYNEKYPEAGGLSAPRNRGGSDGPGRKTGQRIPEQS